MTGAYLILAAATMGIDLGWQPLSDGGVEYIIQIEPELLPLLADNQDVTSVVPSGLDVRRFRITVGTAKLPRDSGRRAANRPPALGAEDAASAKGGLKPLRGDRNETNSKKESPDDDLTSDDRVDSGTDSKGHKAPAPLFGSDESPQRSTIDGRAEPEAQKSNYIDQVDDQAPVSRSARKQTKSDQAAAPSAGADGPARPWLPLLAALVALFASLGVNVYLAWIAWDARREYRSLLQQSLSGGAT